jgi:O-antigen/teichoic acid export membrane protein
MKKIKSISELFKSDSSKDIIWSFFSTVIKIGGGLLVLPLILIKFSTEEIGLWYVFSTVGMFILMIDTGFSATIARNFRYVISNSSIFKNGINDIVTNSVVINTEELLYVSKKIYFYLAFVALIFLGGLSFYVNKLILEGGLDLVKNSVAWGIYSISICLNLRYYYNGAVLNGLNKIHLGQKIDAVSLIINYFSVIIFVYFGFGLISLSVGVLFGLVIRIILYEYFVKIEKVVVPNTKLVDTLRILWPNTWRTGVSNLLGYFIKYLNTYFITIFLGLKIMGSYGITFQIIVLIVGISSIWLNTAYPILNTLRIEKQYNTLYSLFYSRLKKGIVSYIILSTLFVFLGGWVLTFLHAKTQILSINFTLFILFYMFIDFIVNSYGYIIMSGNRIPFIKASLFTTALIIIFNLIFGYFNFGLWGILISTFLAGISYNYWFWIHEGYNELEKLKKNKI